MTWSMRSTLLLVIASSASLMITCGPTPSGGLEGEYCTRDSDCSQEFEEMICERQVCLPLSLFDHRPSREGLFFTVLRLAHWEGATGGNLQQVGQFVSDLSVQLYPYYAVHAISQSQLWFGMVDIEVDPIELDPDYTVTQFAMHATGTGTYEASGGTLLLPVFYHDPDANVELAFYLPLMETEIELQLTDLSLDGVPGTVQLTGYLRAEDAMELTITAGEDTYTLFDVLRDDPLDADSDGDQVHDSWWMAWRGEAVVR